MYLLYWVKKWFQYFSIGLLIYQGLPTIIRTNNSLESYNKIVKSALKEEYKRRFLKFSCFRQFLKKKTNYLKLN